MQQITSSLNNEKKLCPGCKKKWIDINEVYCFDCERAISVEKTEKIVGKSIIPY